MIKLYCTIDLCSIHFANSLLVNRLQETIGPIPVVNNLANDDEIDRRSGHICQYHNRIARLFNGSEHPDHCSTRHKQRCDGWQLSGVSVAVIGGYLQQFTGDRKRKVGKLRWPEHGQWYVTSDQKVERDRVDQEENRGQPFISLILENKKSDGQCCHH